MAEVAVTMEWRDGSVIGWSVLLLNGCDIDADVFQTSDGKWAGCVLGCVLFSDEESEADAKRAVERHFGIDLGGAK